MCATNVGTLRLMYQRGAGTVCPIKTQLLNISSALIVILVAKASTLVDGSLNT